MLVSETVDEPLPTARLVRTARRSTRSTERRRRPSSRAVRRSSPWALTSSDGDVPSVGARSRGPLPVLLDPYGGPHFGRVVRAQRPLLESQWFADQGFVVLVIDGRGTPYRGVSLGAVGAPQLPRSRARGPGRRLARRGRQVSVPRPVAGGDQGWSYGGYLTLGALLRRPDVFRAGISGAPVTDMRLYARTTRSGTSACPTRMSRRTRTPT